MVLTPMRRLCKGLIPRSYPLVATGVERGRVPEKGESQAAVGYSPAVLLVIKTARIPIRKLQTRFTRCDSLQLD
jgi:hypothetical protein